jgi:hypothetical protein
MRSSRGRREETPSRETVGVRGLQVRDGGGVIAEAGVDHAMS